MVELGERIRKGSGLASCLIDSYATDYVGYIVTDESVAEGGYEAGMTVFAPEAGRALADAAARLAREVAAVG